VIDDDDQYKNMKEKDRRKRRIMSMLMGLSFVRHHYIEYQDNEMHVYPTLLDYLKAFHGKHHFWSVKKILLECCSHK
jgi:hypothetical protein